MDRSNAGLRPYWSDHQQQMLVAVGAGLVVDALLGMKPGYKHPEMHKAEERHQRFCREHLNKCLDI